MPEPVETARAAAPARGAVLRGLFGSVRLAYLPVLVTYFCYGASGITSIALLYFQKDALAITPAEAAAIGFWVAAATIGSGGWTPCCSSTARLLLIAPPAPRVAHAAGAHTQP